MAWPAGGGGGGGAESDPTATPLANDAQAAADAAQAAADAAAATAAGKQNADATLTALAAVAWSSGIQVVTLNGADTFLLIRVGDEANQIVRLDGTARLPAVDGSQLLNLPAPSGVISLADDTWIFDTALGTDPGRVGYVAGGFTAGANGTYSDQALYTRVVDDAHSRFLTRAIPVAITETGDFEWRYTMRVDPAANGQASAGIYADWGGSGKGMYFRFGTSGGLTQVYYLNAAGSYSLLGSAYSINPDSSVTVTFRRKTFGSSDGGNLYVYVGEFCVGIIPWVGLRDSVNVNAFRIGHVDTTSNSANEVRIHRVAMRAGNNAQPVALGLATGAWQ